MQRIGYVIINSRGKRVRHKDGTITPYFEYAAQADNYIKKYLGFSYVIQIKRVMGE